jgi:hypothetical protein
MPLSQDTAKNMAWGRVIIIGIVQNRVWETDFERVCSFDLLSVLYCAEILAALSSDAERVTRGTEVEV